MSIVKVKGRSGQTYFFNPLIDRNENSKCRPVDIAFYATLYKVEGKNRWEIARKEDFEKSSVYKLCLQVSSNVDAHAINEDLKEDDSFQLIFEDFEGVS